MCFKPVLDHGNHMQFPYYYHVIIGSTYIVHQSYHGIKKEFVAAKDHAR